MAGRINPTIFDKIAASQEYRSVPDVVRPVEETAVVPEPGDGVGGFSQGILQVNLDSFSENALRANVRRELNWLLNTTNLESSVDLSRYPRVRTSVLNYGISDLTGKAQSRQAIAGRAAKILEAIKVFEPRLDKDSLSVEVSSVSEFGTAVTFVIEGDVTAAVEALHVQYYTDVERDTGDIEVRE